MDYTEFRKEINERHARVGERKERRGRVLRICLDVTVMLLTAALVALIVFRLTR